MAQDGQQLYDRGYQEGDYFWSDGGYANKGWHQLVNGVFVPTGMKEKASHPTWGRQFEWNGPQTLTKPPVLIGSDASTTINLAYVNETPDFTGPKSHRWPDLAYGKGTDFVFFEFGKYIPPFGKDERKETNSGWDAYQESNALQDLGLPSIILPMPQDLSSIIDQNWSGKQFSRAGIAAISALAGAGFGDLSRAWNDPKGNFTALQGALTAGALNKIPGVGGNLTTSDITGSVQGIVLNPNAELLYDSPDMREIQMSYKMVPRNDKEAKSIKKIVHLFRLASVPSWGDEGKTIFEEGTESAAESFGVGYGDTWQSDDQNAARSKENFISVPWLCRFKFMTGAEENKNIPKYKVCAISRVNVNYTADGTYATYSDGAPISTEIQINFLETKAIFKQDIKAGF